MSKNQQRALFNEQVREQLEAKAAAVARHVAESARRGAGVLHVPHYDLDAPQLPPHIDMRTFCEHLSSTATDTRSDVTARLRDHHGTIVHVTARHDGTYVVQNVDPADPWPTTDEQPTFVDWGSSEYPDERVRADRRAARADRPDPFTRMFRALARFFASLPQRRVSRSDTYAVAASVVVGFWAVVAGTLGSPAIGAVLASLMGVILGGVMAWPRIDAQRKQRAAERAARDAEIAARADRQHQLYMRDPEAYLRRIERGETP
ncbi:hypothetical protein SEA_LEONARD_6 [Gordonia phage Leonard]|uniref:Uncharacterized protein n=2 Tax=Leonardvirus TaxID=2948800 RepID=A0A649VLZ7_9CAUD|nr:hypothetical protein BI045_gp06 [Gordonia phage Phinally]YP_010002225.1 hypothetical protein J1769_gp06 [Gordonia phage Leonard]YP_010002481.1 hypothetical protein J1772_gp04 [Gordonia phage Ali17]AMS02998.1 hypothetical protein SEA_PHINALLY_6 [Gordonia phage Phinally]AXQ60620.1 hypothetical protein SEA_ALI17_4 [Gordonia phage Ali17]QGJ93368.1 hypothetical protein SEA_LEONARD_6 [Gordonia phage Leonard]